MRLETGEAVAVEGDLALVGPEEAESRLNAVVLPAPLGPMRPSTSPRAISSERSRTATNPPKRLEMLATWSNGVRAVIRDFSF